VQPSFITTGGLIAQFSLALFLNEQGLTANTTNRTHHLDFLASTCSPCLLLCITLAQELTLEARAASLAATGAQLQQAGSVVVVGGGSVGVELAAELAAHFGTRCRVTLVTSSSRYGVGTGPPTQ
jgi:hypothetical protein